MCFIFPSILYWCRCFGLVICSVLANSELNLECHFGYHRSYIKVFVAPYSSFRSALYFVACYFSRIGFQVRELPCTTYFASLGLYAGVVTILVIVFVTLLQLFFYFESTSTPNFYSRNSGEVIRTRQKREHPDTIFSNHVVCVGNSFSLFDNLIKSAIPKWKFDGCLWLSNHILLVILMLSCILSCMHSY